MLVGFMDWSGIGVQVSAEEPENTASLEGDAEDFIPVYRLRTFTISEMIWKPTTAL